MIAEVYDAFIEAGVSEDKARKAAAAVASFDNRISNLEHKIDRLAIELRIYSTVSFAVILSILWKVWK